MTVKVPMTKAAPAAGKMNRQAETPAARMAMSSLRRLRPTKAAKVPNRKAKGKSSRITDGDFSAVRPKICAAPTSARTPTERDSSTKSTSTMIALMILSAPITATMVWPRT